MMRPEIRLQSVPFAVRVVHQDALREESRYGDLGGEGVEQWGSGVQRMTRACREAGLATPVFEEIGTRFRVTLSTARVGPSALDETDRAIVDALAESEELLTSGIAKVIGHAHSARASRRDRARARGRYGTAGSEAALPQGGMTNRMGGA